ncbi:hypothetical protein [Streptomyces scopuliridis]|uniref:hypothetical protein n=1 Tax=Streptomyces scopuliridis TaxID=452529 RepID=UPI0036C9E730
MTTPQDPDWPAQVAGELFDGLESAGAGTWARRVHHGLVRGDGVPFGLVHDWHAGSVAPLLTEASAQRGGAAEPHLTVRSLHARALAGERIAESVWSAALEPALREVYRYAYAYEEAFATASAAAISFPFAYVRACVRAYGGQDEARGRDARARPAEGLADSLARVIAR